jgi:hypothetical protein
MAPPMAPLGLRMLARLAFEDDAERGTLGTAVSCGAPSRNAGDCSELWGPVEERWGLQ